MVANCKFSLLSRNMSTCPLVIPGISEVAWMTFMIIQLTYQQKRVSCIFVIVIEESSNVKIRKRGSHGAVWPLPGQIHYLFLWSQLLLLCQFFCLHYHAYFLNLPTLSPCLYS